MKVDLQGTKSELTLANNQKDSIQNELKQLEQSSKRDFNTMEQQR